MAFGIPMIHAILQWKSGSEKPVDDRPEPTTNVKSLYLPDVEESTIEEEEEDDMEAEGEEGESITEEDQGDADEHSSDYEQEDIEETDGDNSIGCVQVIENATFGFEHTVEEKEEAAAGRRQPLLGLVLTPTRELAVQVKHHFDAITKFTGEFFMITIHFL